MKLGVVRGFTVVGPDNQIINNGGLISSGRVFYC